MYVIKLNPCKGFSLLLSSSDFTTFLFAKNYPFTPGNTQIQTKLYFPAPKPRKGVPLKKLKAQMLFIFTDII